MVHRFTDEGFLINPNVCHWFFLATLAAAAVVSAAGTLTSIEGQKKAEKARQTDAELQASRERIKMVREARSKRAMVEQSAIDQGSSGSSSAITGMSGITAQANSGQSYITQQQLVGEQFSAAQQQVLNGQSITAFGQGIGAVAAVGFKHSTQVNDIFSPGPAELHGSVFK